MSNHEHDCEIFEGVWRVAGICKKYIYICPTTNTIVRASKVIEELLAFSIKKHKKICPTMNTIVLFKGCCTI